MFYRPSCSSGLECEKQQSNGLKESNMIRTKSTIINSEGLKLYIQY